MTSWQNDPVGRSVSTATFEWIERMILDGELEPGSRLVVKKLADHLGLSPTPVKTALAALERAGLVTSTFQAGYSVPRPDKRVFSEAYQILTELDVLAARIVLAAEDAPSRVQKIAEANDRLTRFEYNFHQMLWKVTDQKQLIEQANLLRGRPLVGSGQLMQSAAATADIQGEHDLIVGALRSRDLPLTEKLLRKHAEKTIARVSVLMDNRVTTRRLA